MRSIPGGTQFAIVVISFITFGFFVYLGYFAYWCFERAGFHPIIGVIVASVIVYCCLVAIAKEE
jgi:hypothetical protein